MPRATGWCVSRRSDATCWVSEQRRPRLRRLGDQLQLVEKLAHDLPEDAPDMLRHFLEKRSYTKALELLMDRMTPEERAAWKPACGH